MRLTRCDALFPFGGSQGAACARIDRPIGAMWCGGARGDVGAGAEAGVEQVHRSQPRQCGLIMIQPGGLVDDLSIPFDTEPLKILDNPRDMLRAATDAIDVFDAEAKQAPV